MKVETPFKEMQPGDSVVIYEFCPWRNVLMLEFGRVTYVDQTSLKVNRVQTTFSETGVATPNLDVLDDSMPEPLQFIYNKNLFRTTRVGSGYVRVARPYNPDCEYIGIRRSDKDVH